MARGRNNKLVGQVGEFLVAAELARRLGLIATPFAGNVPGFDVVAIDEHCRAIPIQVKTANGGDWQFDAGRFARIQFDSQSRTQSCGALLPLALPDLIHVLVWLGANGEKDRYFVLRAADLQRCVVDAHKRWLARHNGRRPRKPESTHCAIGTDDLKPFEDEWGLIQSRLAAN